MKLTNDEKKVAAAMLDAARFGALLECLTAAGGRSAYRLTLRDGRTKQVSSLGAASSLLRAAVRAANEKAPVSSLGPLGAHRSRSPLCVAPPRVRPRGADR